MQGCKERHLSQDYISWLLAAASDHFWAPLPEGACKAKSVDETDAPAPAALDVRGSDTLVQPVPDIEEATEATDRYPPPELSSREQLMLMEVPIRCHLGVRGCQCIKADQETDQDISL